MSWNGDADSFFFPVVAPRSRLSQWVVTSLGLYSQNLRVVALYASLGENAVEFIVNNGDVGMVCVSKKELPNLLKALPKCKGVTHIIQFDHDAKYNNVEDALSEADIAKCKDLGVELITFSHVKKLGNEQNKVIFPNPAKADDIAYIMYTSGQAKKGGKQKSTPVFARSLFSLGASTDSLALLLSLLLLPPPQAPPATRRARS